MMLSQVNKCLKEGGDVNKLVHDTLNIILEECVPGDWDTSYSPKIKQHKYKPDFKINVMPSFSDSIMIEEKNKERMDQLEKQKGIKTSFHNAIQNARNYEEQKVLAPPPPVIKKTVGKYRCPARKSSTNVSKKVSKNETPLNINSAQDFPSL